MPLGIPFNTLKLMKSVFTGAQLARNFAQGAGFQFAGSYATQGVSSLFTGLALVSGEGTYASIVSLWGGMFGPNVTMLNLATVVGGGSPLLGALSSMSLQDRLTYLSTSFLNSPQGIGMTPVGIIGSSTLEGKGVVSMVDFMSTPGAVGVPICICSNCTGIFGGSLKHQFVTVGFVPDASEVLTRYPEITKVPPRLPDFKIPDPNVGGSAKIIKIPPEEVKPDPPDFRIGVGIFLDKVARDMNKELGDMHVAVTVRGNMGYGNAFSQLPSPALPNGTYNQQPYFWMNPIDYGAYPLWTNELLVSNEYFATIQNPLDSTMTFKPLFTNQRKTRIVDNREGVNTNGVNLFVEQKVINNTEYVHKGYFTVTMYFSASSTKYSPLAISNYYYLIRQMLGVGRKPFSPNPAHGFWLDFMGSPTYDSEQQTTVTTVGRWARLYAGESYDPNSLIDVYGNEVALSPNTNSIYIQDPDPDAEPLLLPKFIYNGNPFANPPAEYPSYNTDPVNYHWYWDDYEDENSIVYRDVFFTQGYRLRYQRPHTAHAKIAYLGSERRMTKYQTETSFYKDFATLINTTVIAGYYPSGALTYLTNFLIQLIPDTPTEVTRSAEHHHFAIQWDIPYELYYGAWTDPGLLEIKPFLGNALRFAASPIKPLGYTGRRKGPDLHWNSYPGGSGASYLMPDRKYSRTIGPPLSPIEVAEVNDPSWYRLTRTDLVLPDRSSEAIRAIKSPNPVSSSRFQVVRGATGINALPPPVS